MGDNWTDVDFTVDLVSAAQRHLHFLDNVDNCEKVLTESTLRHALRRYELLWLPLVAANKTESIVAPIDIAWMWYCHTLSPNEYRYDCKKLVKKTLTHSFVKEQDIIRNTNNAIEMWYGRYPAEGFNIIRHGDTVVGHKNNVPFQSRLSVSLVEVAMSQMNFCYQVALPHYRDTKYLQNALVRYKQFLILRKAHPKEFLTPSVDVLLMWYTHMAHPIEYAYDTKRLFGKVLPNNVKVIAGRTSSKLTLARENTRELWKKISSEEMVQPGTVFRGRERSKEISEMVFEDLKYACVMLYRVHLSHIEMTDLPRAVGSFDLKLCRTDLNSKTEEMKMFKGSKRTRLWTFKLAFDFNTVKHKTLSMSITKKKRIWCMKGYRTYASGQVELTPLLDKLRPMERSLSFDVVLTRLDTATPVKVVVDGAAEDPIAQVCDLTLKPQPFEKKCLTVKELLRVWGPSALPRIAKDASHDCFIGDHGLVNHNGDSCFGVRVVHVPSLMSSGVQVNFRGKLVASSHVIGSSQLPSHSQVDVSGSSMAFDPASGERAMLIRNHRGDWGLCIGQWMSGDGDDFLSVRFMSLVSNRGQKTLDVKKVHIQFHSFDADLGTGHLLINPTLNTIAENIALIFSICMLHVLCSPTTSDRRIVASTYRLAASSETETIGSRSNMMEALQNIYTAEDRCPLLVASGHGVETPCNEYILRHHGSLLSDLMQEAEDIVVEENRALTKRDSEVSAITAEPDVTPRQRRRKKRSSKLTEEAVVHVPVRIDEKTEPERETDRTVDREPSVNIVGRAKIISSADGEETPGQQERNAGAAKRTEESVLPIPVIAESGVQQLELDTDRTVVEESAGSARDKIKMSSTGEEEETPRRRRRKKKRSKLVEEPVLPISVDENEEGEPPLETDRTVVEESVLNIREKAERKKRKKKSKRRESDLLVNATVPSFVDREINVSPRVDFQ